MVAAIDDDTTVAPFESTVTVPAFAEFVIVATPDCDVCVTTYDASALFVLIIPAGIVKVLFRTYFTTNTV